ncbi:MAG: S8 family serine peptidase [Gammaproteobacteria bacterium]|nr:S8 family serine peptidase [Gammaproteobacteria bacterium]
MLATVVWLFGDGSPGGPEGLAIEQSDELPAAMVVATDRKLRRQTGDRARSGSGVPQSADATAALAEGYSVVRHLGRMVEGGAMARSDGDRPAGPDWLRGADGPQRLAALAAAAGRPWTFGYVELSSPTGRAALERSLAAVDARVVGSSGRLVRARLPGDVDVLRDIAELPEVAGLGAAPAASKLRSFDVEGSIEPDDAARLPVFVTLMEGDRDGGWGRSLRALGAGVGGYDADTRAYTAAATQDVVRAMAEADFVAAVEPIRRVTALNDTAVPAMGADALRSRDFSNPGAFTGVDGSAAVVGVMDTGLNLNHPDIRTGRESVCGANIPWPADREDELIEDEDLWLDSDGHGTHVTGTILGNGADDPTFAGMAPGVRHIRFAKVLDRFGSGTDDTIRRGMDYLSSTTRCGGADGPEAKPHLVNMSLGGSSRSWSARTAGERKLDATVWGKRQLYVVAQGNEAQRGFGHYAAAKNSLAVGAVHDTGGHATFTSVGPTGDGRLAPQVAGTGMNVHSARGQGSPGGYDGFSGTSMASPSVAGVAALLMDALPSHRDNPALARARLMASAIRPDAWLDDPAAFPLDNSGGPGTIQNVYGMGKVSAHTAVLDGDNEHGWRSGSATAEPEDGEYVHVDIEVPAGASRLDLVLTWDEPPADTVARSVLNDLDLWLDRDADCEEARCGEHSSRSRIDNVEWIIVRNPEPGTYRAKVAAEAVYTAPPRAALAWTVIRGASTPRLRMHTTPIERLPADRTSEFRAVISSDGYVTSGTLLRVDCVSASDGCDGVKIESAALAEDGGVLRPLEVPDRLDHSNRQGGVFFGAWFLLGEIHRGGGGKREDVEVLLRVRAGSDPATLRLVADSWNAAAAVATVAVGDAPATNPASPGNDGFAGATRIEGTEGSVAASLSRATSEPGEPTEVIPAAGSADDDNRFARRPAASLWYGWTAPESATYHFAVSRPDGGLSRHARVGVYEGERLVSLRQVGGSLYNVSIAAERERTYRVRVASFERAEQVSLRWSSGRPANDDFADAVALEGESGDAEGTDAGATLEPGESWGSLAGTTWYRWTAPEDGDWSFYTSVVFEEGTETVASSGLPRAYVFAGDSLVSLRLVSPYNKHDGYVSLRSGVEYRIAVMSVDPDGTPHSYTLNWHKTSSKPNDNDGFAAAEALEAASSSRATVHVDDASSVEPGEPPETGVRTRWWKWEVPEDGRYTWRAEDRGEYPAWRVEGIPGIQIRAFRGESVGELDLMGGAGPYGPHEFALDVLADDTVHFSAGLAQDGSEAFDVRSASVDLAWGPTPANDDPAAAAVIRDAEGSISGSNRFATSGAGVRTDVVGRSAVWWEFEAPADGWYRFSADGRGWAVAVHDADGADIAAASAWQRREGAASVLFYAEAGTRHRISLGSLGASEGGDFTLRWGTAEAPVWLRYAGRLVDGDRSREDGGPVEIRRPGDLAVLPDGAPWTRSALYLASGIGLSVFSRDPESGDLTLEQGDVGDLSRASLAMDADNTRLLAQDCGSWQSYSLSADGVVRVPTTLNVADDPGNCGRLLLDGGRGFVYLIGESGVDAFAVDGDGALSFDETYAVAGLRGAAMDGAGRIYAAGDDGLLVLERDAGTGSLSATETGERLAVSSATKVPLAVGPEDERLFAVDDEGTHVFALDDPLAPQRLGSLPRSHREHVRPWLQTQDRCGFAAIRGGFALDVFCRSQSFTAEWEPDGGTLSETDRMDDGTPDRFNSLVPDFGLPAGMAASADGRHVYVSTPMHGILVFERVAVPSAAGEGVETPANRAPVAANPVGDQTVDVGETLTVDLSAVFEDPDGDAIVSYGFKLSNANLSGRVHSRTGELTLIGESTGSTTVTANACDAEICGEHDFVVRVLAAQQADLVVESAAVDDDTPDAAESFTLSATVRNRGDGGAEATTLRYYRSANPTISTGDTEVGTDAVGTLGAGGSSAESIGLTAPSSAGTYYYGACVDSVTGESSTANNCSDGVEVEVSGGGTGDDHGDDIGSATSVSVPSTTDGELEEGGDRDYFRLSVSEDTTLTVETTGSTDTYGTLFDADGSSLETDDDGGAGTNFEIERDVDVGTYYVEVRGFSSSTTGTYQLEVSAESGGGGGNDVFGGLAAHLRSCDDIPVGISLNHDTEDGALDGARDACEDDGGSASACGDLSGSFERCGVTVYSEFGITCNVNLWSISGASSRSGAEDSALQECRLRGNTGCRILTNDDGERMSGCNSAGGSSSAATALESHRTNLLEVLDTRSMRLDKTSR